MSKDKQDKPLRNMSYEDYGISKHRYLELKNFCLQYNEKKRKIRYAGSKAISYDGMPHSSNVGRPVEQEAIRNIMNQRDCELIEQAVIEASPELYSYILLNVTEGVPYEWLGDVPICDKDFYAYRRLFFHYLDLKR